jgi:hypothetical protein
MAFSKPMVAGVKGNHSLTLKGPIITTHFYLEHKQAEAPNGAPA